MIVVGVDLAWGEHRGDGVCVLETDAGSDRARVVRFAYPHGDVELLRVIDDLAPEPRPALVAIDGPIVCPNATGSRPVDRETHRRFHREHAGCHPANATRCVRPPRVRAALETRGFVTGTDLARPRLVTEVYPHPALVRLLRLPRIVKYKRGRVAARRLEFARLQALLADFVARELPGFALDGETQALLRAPWAKPVEDRVDALVCALVGLWHLRHGGRRSEVLGDLATGFLLLPEDLRTMPFEVSRPACASRGAGRGAAPSRGRARGER